MTKSKTYQCNKCGATGTDIKAISKGVCHKPIMKTNKLREETLNKLDNQYSLAWQDGNEGLNRRSKWWKTSESILETAIQAEKKKWKQEALKAIDKIDDSSIEVKQGDSYLKKGTVGTSGIVGKVTITTSNVKEKCKKVIIEL